MDGAESGLSVTASGPMLVRTSCPARGAFDVFSAEPRSLAAQTVFNANPPVDQRWDNRAAYSVQAECSSPWQ